MSRYWEDGCYSQPTTSELKRKSEASRVSAEKKGKRLEPVVIQGRNIAKSWWGRAWCDNLERYADYESRLDRGKRYVKTGAVIDLSITKGRNQAKVQGSRKTPYKVERRISPLSEERWRSSRHAESGWQHWKSSWPEIFLRNSRSCSPSGAACSRPPERSAFRAAAPTGH